MCNFISFYIVPETEEILVGDLVHHEKAEDIVVVTIIAGQLIVATAPRRRR